MNKQQLLKLTSAFNLIADTPAIAKALAEYQDSASEATVKLISAIASIPLCVENSIESLEGWDPEDDAEYLDFLETNIESIAGDAEEIFLEDNYDKNGLERIVMTNPCIMVDLNHFTTPRSIIHNHVQAVINAERNELISGEADDHGLVLPELEIWTTESIKPKKGRYNLDEICEFLKRSLHASVTCGAALFASTLSEASGRLSSFRDRISRFFSQSYADYSGYASYFTKILETTGDVTSSVIYNFFNVIGLDKFQSDNIAPDVFSSSYLSQFTGATPVAANAGKTAVKVLKTVGKVLLGILSVAFGPLVQLYRLISNGIKNVRKGATNPFEITIDDDHLSSLTMGELYHRTSMQGGADSYINLHTPQIINSVLFSTDGVNIGDAINSVNKHFNGQVIRVNNLLFDACANLHKGPVTWAFGWQGEVDMRFKFIDPDIYKKTSWQDLFPISFDASSGAYSFNISSKATSIDYVYDKLSQGAIDYKNIGFTQYSRLYDQDAKEERRITFGVMLSTWLSIVMTTVIQGDGEGFDFAGIKSRLQNSDLFWSGSLGNVNNVHLCSLASGWNGDASSPAFSMENALLGRSKDSSPLEINVFSIFDICSVLTVTTAQLIMDRMVDLPEGVTFANVDQFPFVPYNVVSGFELLQPTFIIKTSEEATTAWENLVAGILLVVIAAAVTVAATVVVRSVSNKLMWKKRYLVSQLNAKMATGGVLTFTERRKYSRYTKGLASSGSILAGLTSSDFSESGGSIFAGTTSDATHIINKIENKIEKEVTTVSGDVSALQSSTEGNTTKLQNLESSITKLDDLINQVKSLIYGS